MYNLHYGRWQNSKYSLTLNKCVHKNPHRVSKAAFIGMVFNFSRIFRSVLVSKELNGVFVHNRHCMVQVDTLLFSCGPVWQDIYIAQYCIIDSVVYVFNLFRKTQSGKVPQEELSLAVKEGAILSMCWLLSHVYIYLKWHNKVLKFKVIMLVVASFYSFISFCKAILATHY